MRQRGEQAAASFNCSFDAFRRARRSTGISLLDETVRQLAVAIQSLDQPGPRAGAPEGPATSNDVVDITSSAMPETHRSSSRRRIAVVVGIAVILLGTIGLIALVKSHRESHAATTADPPSTVATTPVSNTPAACTHPIGVSSDPSLKAYQVPFATQIEELTPPGDPRSCGQTPVTRWDLLVIQPLSLSDKANGALVATDPDHILMMSQAEFTSYHQIGGKDGTQAQNLAGLPRRRKMTKTGKVWLILTDHGAMASQGVDQPGFYVGGPPWTRWQATGEDSGEMGIPASNPLNNAVGYYQDFSKGRATLSYSGSFTFQRVADPAASLPKGFRGQILRHDDGTTWYVDNKDVRHWIPDGDTWYCIHDRGSQEIGHVPGYAIATLKLGKPATCSAPKKSKK